MHEIIIETLAWLGFGWVIDDKGFKKMLAKLKMGLEKHKDAIDINSLDLSKYIDTLEKNHDGNKHALSLLKSLKSLEAARADLIFTSKLKKHNYRSNKIDDIRYMINDILRDLPECIE